MELPGPFEVSARLKLFMMRNALMGVLFAWKWREVCGHREIHLIWWRDAYQGMDHA